MDIQFDFNKEFLYDALTSSTDDYIYILNLKTNIMKLSEKFVRDFNLPGVYIKNFEQIWQQKVHPDDRHLYVNSIKNIMTGKEQYHNIDYRVLNRKGEWQWIRCRGKLIFDKENNADLFAGFIINIGKTNKVDNTTGLLTKYEFENQINYYLCKNKSFCVSIINIDNFRNINELYDREFGDSVLRITGQYLQNMLSNTANVYRLDGDEFGVISTYMGDEQIKQVYQDIKRHFSTKQEYKAKKYHLTLSAGCYLYKPNLNDNIQSILKKAHKALDYAKKNGKNRMIFYVPKLFANKTRKLEIIEFLYESIENNFENFELFCQPQVYAENGVLKGAEALLRWKCEKYGSISPVEFIPLLEEANLIIPVGRWVFEQAVKRCAEWVNHCPKFKMSINISYMQLLDPDFVDFMRDVIQKEGIDFENIIVELTESRFVSDKKLLKNNFDAIRKLGMKVAMDDFGTGYSSLEMLKEVPADIVKIDKAFVRNIKNSSFDTTFIKFVVELCHDVGIKVCLEGIEKKEELDIISCMNLDYIQGYFFGVPQDKDSFYKNFLKK